MSHSLRKCGLHPWRSEPWLALGGALVLAGLILAGCLTGCGEKIAIPEAEGLFSTSGYLKKPGLEMAGLQQLTVIDGLPFVLTVDSLFKLQTNFARVVSVGGLEDARALCVSDYGRLIFVWEQGNHRVSWYNSADLEFRGESFLPELLNPVAMTTSSAGVEQLGVDTFLYLSDPEAGVIHRYAFSDFQGLFHYGILARSDGDGTRFVHLPAGMCRDRDGKLLVCDADLNRNWVIRFDSTPDEEDVTPDPSDEDPLRGTAILFTDPACEPPAPAEYVLGDAAVCNQTDWEGGPSDATGEFASPTAVTIDGSGRIFVADTGNDRVQAFSAEGQYLFLFGKLEDSPAPSSIGVADVKDDELNVYFAAFVFLAHPEQGLVSRWVSKEFNETRDADYFDQ